jgi:hypothetical protein
MASNRNVKVDEFVEALTDDIKEMTERLRDIIHEADGNFKEEVKWKMPCFSIGNADVCYLQPAKNM